MLYAGARVATCVGGADVGKELRALKSGVDGGNGVYVYTSSTASAFPMRSPSPRKLWPGTSGRAV